MKAALSFLSLLIAFDSVVADDTKRTSQLPAGCEVVMPMGMRITATTSLGTITITAVDELTRSYTWEGATRSIAMAPRAKRWYGSLGLVNPGAGEHWREHHGITRSVTEEGQQHFKTEKDAQAWIKERNWMPFVYRNDGLMVGWNKNLGRKQLSVEVWQILIDGKKPKRLDGARDDKIVVETVETESIPLVKAVMRSDVEAAKALLANGADPNARNSIDVPVLFLAIQRESVALVEVLLKHKADPNIRDLDSDITPLMQALGRMELVKKLLDAGADINAGPRTEGNLFCGMTPLMLAVLDGDEALTQLFLDRGANVSAKTPDGQTALSLARMLGSEKSQGVIRKLEAAMKK